VVDQGPRVARLLALVPADRFLDGVDHPGVLPLDGRRVELDLEHQGAHLNKVPVAQAALDGQADAVDQGAVAAAQVADPDSIGRDRRQAGLPADPIAVGPDVALGATAEDVLAAGETEVLVLGPSVDDAQTDDHGAVLPASPRPPAPWAPCGSGGTG